MDKKPFPRPFERQTPSPFPYHPGRGRKAGAPGPELRYFVCVQTAREAFEKLGAVVMLTSDAASVWRHDKPVAMLPLEGTKKDHVCARQYRHASRLLWIENLSRSSRR